MNKHTPGPWECCERLSGSENHKGFYVKSQKFVLAYEVIPVDSDGNEGKANARLMACAPDLLEALEAMTALAEGPVGGVTVKMKRDVIATARTAIAKARGESSRTPSLSVP